MMSVLKKFEKKNLDQAEDSTTERPRRYLRHYYLYILLICYLIMNRLSLSRYVVSRCNRLRNSTSSSPTVVTRTSAATNIGTAAGNCTNSLLTTSQRVNITTTSPLLVEKEWEGCRRDFVHPIEISTRGADTL